ncbi:hypothetical protein QAD02_007965 [Eretmocerus hayati]|uniref:Uncharacterized protein n=1 Tax=Eretmocerus hayati TaxID=131215 RepID=A0ACC2N6G1_9HYME|nr:hypothetical protein QAD02_007965 [Eretmocerus hayati]
MSTYDEVQRAILVTKYSESCLRLYCIVLSSPAGSSSGDSHTCDSDRDVSCYICGEFELRNNRRSITKDNRISYKECYGFAMSVTAWSPDSLCSKCRVMLFQFCKFGKRDSLRIASPALWRKPSTREDCYFCMTDIQGISATTKCRIKYATVLTTTVPVLSPNLRQGASILIVSDVESGSEKVSQSEDKEGFETDEAESVGHGIEEDRVEQKAEVQDDASDKTSSNETSAEEDSEEDIPAGGECGSKLFNQKQLNDSVRYGGLSKDVAEFMAAELVRRKLVQPGTKSSNTDERGGDSAHFMKRSPFGGFHHDMPWIL